MKTPTLIILMLSFSLFSFTQDYASTKLKFDTLRTSYQSNDSLDIVIEWEVIFVNELIPKWYGTKWDFNGISATPGQGEIACGYFVSTTLLHAGFNLNRYKVAQQDALTISRVCAGTTDYKFSNFTYSELCSKLNEIEDGLYIAGLSNHVGFIYKRNGNCYFIHSDPYTKSAVTKEKIDNSVALEFTDVLYLSRIDKTDLESKWVKQERISLNN